LNRDSLDPQQSVLSQRKDPDLYPEGTAIGRAFGRIQTFRDWSFGRYTLLRQPQPADLPNDILLPDARNLGLILNSIENSDEGLRLNESIKRFLPRFRRFSISVQAGTVQILLHEDGLRSPIPATRLSDGTIRFIAILTILLRPALAPLICLDEPELGLHPDALTIIAELLVDAARHTQIVVTTHSDALVSALTEHAESVVVSENLAGSTRLRRLDSQKLQYWLKKYRLGEIWRIGELGGNP
jgi:predicted ATPase